MHAVREELLEAQAVAAGSAAVEGTHSVAMLERCLREAMGAAMAQARAEGIIHVAFGDLFLEDIRRYREEKLHAVGMTPVFPLWGRDTHSLAREMVAGGLRAYLTCVDPRQLDRRFAGRPFDASLLDELPAGVDPCGEKGEFHTFAFAGPMFSPRWLSERGEIVERDGFVFADLLPARSVATGS